MLMKRIHGSTESSTLISCETHSLSYRSGNRSKIPSFTLPSSWWGLHCLQCLGFHFLTIRRGQNLRSSGYRLVNKLAFHNRVTSVESLLVKIYTHLACTFAYIMSIFRPYTLSWTFWRRAKRLPLQRLGRIQIEALSTTFLVSPKYWTSSRLWSMIYRRFWSLTVGPNAPLNDACAVSQNRAGSAVSALRGWHAIGIPLRWIVLGRILWPLVPGWRDWCVWAWIHKTPPLSGICSSEGWFLG